MTELLRLFFFGVAVRFLLLIILGMNVRRREALPAEGPAVLVANHNSHLDVLALMSLYPLRRLRKLRPVAARDYFLKNKWLAWFSLNIMGVVPIDRTLSSAHAEPLAPVEAALDRGEIVILFPEGSRGEPERLGEFKTGVAHLAKSRPEVPFFPVFMHGLGKALPRGEALLVPCFCDVFVGEPLRWTGDKHGFMEALGGRMTALANEGDFAPWQ